MKDLFVFFAHLLSAFTTVLKPGGAKSLVAENLLLREQFLLLRRSRRRTANLHAKDRALGVLGFLLHTASNLTELPVRHRHYEGAYNIITGSLTAWDFSLPVAA